MKTLLVACGAATMVAGCDQIAGPSYDYETPVRGELRDPESAQFSDVEVSGTVACGFVNSKNGYGGYAGRVPFVVRDNMATIISEPGEQPPGLVNAVCPEKAAAKIYEWITEETLRRLKAAT